MKKILKYTAFAAMVGLFSSCSDSFFEAESGDIITSDQMDEVDPVAGLNGMYAYLYKFDTMGYGDEAQHYDYGYHHILLCSDLWGQDMIQYSSKYGWYYTDYQFNQNSRAYQYISTFYFWNYLYKLIKSANDVLKTTTDDSKKEDRGQALGMRAFAYLTLVQMYQHTYAGHENSLAVPIVTETMTDEDMQNNPRATVQQVYDQIMSDLNTAADLLTGYDNGSNKDQIDEAVVYGLRARANLLMQKWADAAKDAERAIAGGTPQTLAQVSTPTFNSASASSWLWGVMITPDNDVVQTGIINWPSHLCSFTGNGYTSGVPDGYRKVNSALYDLIPETDIRKQWFLSPDNKSSLIDNEQIEGTSIVEYFGLTPYVNTKFGAYQSIFGNTTNASDWPLMRVEEMYLIKAEAEAMGGNLSGGKSTLENFVRTYRDPSFTSKANSAQDFQDEVWLQRRMELWREGFSLFDILRLKKPVVRKNTNYDPSVQYNSAAEAQILIYRIPQCEMETNSGISDTDNNPAAPQPQL